VHTSIELLIGRLITDEDFRAAFRRDARGTLTGPRARELVLTPLEVEAILATDATLWERVADELDARLQKASLRLRGDALDD
jgi:hypothetical protein